MCGIAGLANLAETPVDEALLRRMTRTLAHRGPDGEGFYTDGPIGLGHRRLSIIDLSTGSQPMASADGAAWIVFNGEIYNFRELRTELMARGHRFRTSSDTEVILSAYATWGDDCVRHLRGMFAFALWDRRRRRLLLARDRAGIKPLVYAWDGQRLLFASELKALLEDRAVSARHRLGRHARLPHLSLRAGPAHDFPRRAQAPAGLVPRARRGRWPTQRRAVLGPALLPRRPPDGRGLAGRAAAPARRRRPEPPRQRRPGRSLPERRHGLERRRRAHGAGRRGADPDLLHRLR